MGVRRHGGGQRHLPVWSTESAPFVIGVCQQHGLVWFPVVTPEEHLPCV